MGGAREQTFCSNAPPTGTLFSVFARYLAEVKRLQYGNPLSTTLVWFANTEGKSREI